MRTRRMAAAAAITLSTALVLSACSSNDSDSIGAGFEDCDDNPAECNSGERAEGGDFVWAMDAEWNGWSTWDAATANSATAVVSDLIRPSMGVFDPDGDWIVNDGIFAEGPELIEEDPLTVQYHLNPDANWGGGNPINYEDFLWHWWHESGDEEKCAECTPASGAYGPNVDAIDEIDENTIQVTYREGYTSPEWMHTSVLSHPAHIAEERGYPDWKTDPDQMRESVEDFVTNPPLDHSTGPFILVDEEPGDWAQYEPNPDWAGSTHSTLDSLTIESFESTEAIFTEMRQGTVHAATTGRYDPEILGQLESEDGIRYNLAPGGAYDHVSLNIQNPTLADQDLRTAVFTAIDVQDMIDRTYGVDTDDVERRTSLLFPNSSEHHVDNLTETGQGSGDVEAAREILEDADYTWDDSDTLIDPDGDAVELTYRVRADSAPAGVHAELVQSYMESIGIDLTLDSYQSGDMGAMLDAGEFEMAGYGYISAPLFATTPSGRWHSEANGNTTNVDNEDLDAIVDTVLQTADPEEAAARGNEAADIAVEEAFILPVANSPVLILASEDVVNVRDNWATVMRAVYNVEEWGFAVDEE